MQQQVSTAAHCCIRCKSSAAAGHPVKSFCAICQAMGREESSAAATDVLRWEDQVGVSRNTTAAYCWSCRHAHAGCSLNPLLTDQAQKSSSLRIGDSRYACGGWVMTGCWSSSAPSVHHDSRPRWTTRAIIAEKM